MGERAFSSNLSSQGREFSLRKKSQGREFFRELPGAPWKAKNDPETHCNLLHGYHCHPKMPLSELISSALIKPICAPDI